MAHSIFELKGIYYSYLRKIPALCGIDLTIEEGSKIVLLGANGTGKSTLLSLLDGLIFPDKGSIKVFGRELSEEALRDESFSRLFRSKVGFVFQNPDIQLFCPTVKEDILFGPLQLGVEKSEALRRLDELSAMFNIRDLLERSPHQLSVGEKRKVAIASTMAVGPEVILLDEPTAGLDPATTRQIVGMLLDASSRGRTIVTATHDMHIVEEIADRVCVMDGTKTISRCSDPQSLMHDRAFLEAHNLIHAHKHRHDDTTHVHPHEHIDHHHS